MSDDEIWRLLNEDDDNDSDFHGFRPEDVEEAPEYESDIDLDFDNIEVSPVSTPEMSEESESEEEEIRPNAMRNRNAWSTQLSEISPRPFTQDVGAKHDKEVGALPIDYFHLLIPDPFLATIVDETNRYAEQQQEQSRKRDAQWKPVTLEEVKLFLAIGIMMGIHKLPRQKLYWARDDRLNVPSISQLMSQNRYEKISKYLHLNNNANYVKRGFPGFDPLFKLRPLLDCTTETFKKYYLPNRELSIDEAMIRFNGRLYFKQYIRQKPSPWGIKVWCCADPKNGYLLTYDVYTGKTEHTAAGKFIFSFLLFNFCFTFSLDLVYLFSIFVFFLCTCLFATM